MSTMNISLPESLKAFVDEQVSERGYGTSSEYVRELIRKDQDRLQLRSLLLAGASTAPAAPAETDLAGELDALAGQLGSQGQVLESYLKTGKLPPALQAQLDQAKQSEKARIIAGAAARGQPTDPRMNSALAQELNNVDTNAIAAMAKVQVDMLNTGLKETGMSMELYQMLTKLDMQQNEDLMKSISSFAAALGGGFGGAPARAT